ncbi:hypothetical protein Amal_01753 [Acetobacter malorum]|uniref:Uncharacterized protein n=1 Tax=Acetobacter malorum TaxID=178901 RepID=A0A177G6R1_9PROT|nr:hypothetical protein [Acetobacter malorum]OAG75983.1 hypothetical protein Amal_01753 [Acetobacter malorum]
MTTGDQADFARRIRQLLPFGWFPAPPSQTQEEKAPVLNGVLQGMGNVLEWVFDLFAQVNAQMRLATASGDMLGMIAYDYFGDSLPRASDETDDAYRARIQQSLVAAKNTREAVAQALRTLTGEDPTIVEPTRAADCRGLGNLASPAVGGGYGYGVPGLYYGALDGGQFFVSIKRGNAPSTAAIYAAINNVRAEGVTAWVKVEN